MQPRLFTPTEPVDSAPDVLRTHDSPRGPVTVTATGHLLYARVSGTVARFDLPTTHSPNRRATYEGATVVVGGADYDVARSGHSPFTCGWDLNGPADTGWTVRAERGEAVMRRRTETTDDVPVAVTGLGAKQMFGTMMRDDVTFEEVAVWLLVADMVQTMSPGYLLRPASP